MKVLIIRFSSIGDIVLTSPVIRCVAKQLQAEVHFLTKSVFTSLVEHNPFVKKVHAFSSFSQILPQLEDQNFDLIIDLHHNLRSKKIKSALKTKCLSYNKASIKRLLLTTLRVDLLKGNHIVDRYFSAFSKGSVVNDQKGLEFFYPKLTFPKLPSSYIVIVVGTAHFTKNLTKTLIEDLIESFEVPVVLIGGKDHTDFGKSLMVPTKRNVINLIGETDLLQSAGIIDKAELIISPDTGMMHIAAALNKPVIAVYGSTSSKLGFTPYNAVNRFKIVENNSLSCRPCTKQGHAKCPKGHFKCMKELKSQEIVDKSKELIDL